MFEKNFWIMQRERNWVNLFFNLAKYWNLSIIDVEDHVTYPKIFHIVIPFGIP
jgi:hypothetical protein